MRTLVSVGNGVKIGMRHPRSGARILAKTLASALNGEEWITREFKFKFCAMFVENLIDGSVERSVDPKLLEKVKRRSFGEGILLMRKRPEMGMRFMLAIVMQELRECQGLDDAGQHEFYEELLANFFPEFKVSDFIRSGGGDVVRRENS